MLKNNGTVESPTYRSWAQMKRRCYDKKSVNFHLYGGRGISVCERWRNSFMSFYDDMGTRPDGKSLDRIDPNGNYEPGNVRWATKKEQCSNKRPKTRCGRGHELNEQTVYIQKGGGRLCKLCVHIRGLRRSKKHTRKTIAKGFVGVEHLSAKEFKKTYRVDVWATADGEPKKARTA